VLYCLGGIPEFQFLDFSLDAGWFGIGVVAFVLVWLLNLFNFMDGIDGIAASEAIFVSSAGAFFSWLMGSDNISIILLILAASTTGFLALNWPPAKIFMGDVGSNFLGLIIGVIAYASILEGASVWIWLILLAVFLVDSGVTLLRRILNGEKWHEAHCSHAYQHAAKKWGHKKVTISVILINIL
jgi:Fuc2NAc and GlcNAc transferase